MRKFTLGAVVGFLLASAIAWAGQIPEPPPIKDTQTLLYLRRIKDNWLNVSITTTNPNGSMTGRLGDIIVWNDSGTYRWRLNTSSTPGVGTTWSSISS